MHCHLHCHKRHENATTPDQPSLAPHTHIHPTLGPRWGACLRGQSATRVGEDVGVVMHGENRDSYGLPRRYIHAPQPTPLLGLATQGGGGWVEAESLTEHLRGGGGIGCGADGFRGRGRKTEERGKMKEERGKRTVRERKGEKIEISNR